MVAISRSWLTRSSGRMTGIRTELENRHNIRIGDKPTGTNSASNAASADGENFAGSRPPPGCVAYRHSYL
jgi:hypothetical protein